MTRSDTVISKLQCMEDSLKDNLFRLDVIEKKLKTRLLTMENREKLEKELKEIKEVLRINDEKLRRLRKENSKSFVVAACLICACFLFYGLYLMIFENI